MGAPKKAKKKIQIEEVDSSEEPPKKAKKKIQIEEVDSSAPKEEAPKKAKKKIQIEEVDSSAEKKEADAAAALRFKEEGNAKFKARNFAEAEALYSKGLNLDPKNTAVLSNRAVVRIQLGDNAGAEADCSAALVIGIPEASQTKVLYRRAMARHAQKKNEDAEKDVLAALTLSPGNADCEKLLKEVRAAIGRPTELEVTPEEPPKKAKKKIQIEEVDSSAPKEEAPKKA